MDSLGSVFTQQKRSLGRLGGLKPIHDTLPPDFGLVEIDKKTNRPTGGFQVVKTLGDMFVGKALDTFQFQHQDIFD